ncbi:MAG TPA: lipopolysaccharide biosynthesis protein [Nitrospirota bacterium]|nr:lipopolysaccharide biosynthesis protein [Nitrospirota bacterium]
MIDSSSVKTRFIVSVLSNTVRSVIGFFSGLLIARGLNPAGYGDMMFLLGSFVAVRTLLDMGTSSAFYTFISQRPRSRRFYLYYYAWLALQFVIPAVLIIVLLPNAMIEKVWLGHSRTIILLSFAAAFMQQQVWQTLNQIGEASRKTIRVQIICTAVAIGHLGLVFMLLAYDLLSVRMVFLLLIGEYPLAALWAFRFLRDKEATTGPDESGALSAGSLLKEYWLYCQPLAFLSLVAFLYEFADRWLLQRFGGPSQQGFYQIAYQFASVSLLATTSILNVFWKEIAEANARQDKQRLAALYHKVSRSLVMLGAVLSGFLIPWTEQIVAVLLGKSYLTAVPVLVIMFLYPIHQSMGQIGGTMLLAGGHTTAYTKMSIAMMLISLPLAYLVQAPTHGVTIPGLGLGAVGMALKMILLNILSVNILAWLIARYHGWKFEWLYQVIGIGLVMISGYAAKQGVGLFWQLSRSDAIRSLLPPFLTAGVFYLILVSIFIWMMPWLIGMDRQEMRHIVAQFKSALGVL